MGTQNGMQKNSVSVDSSDDYSQVEQSEGTQNGTRLGTIQYIYSNNNIIEKNNIKKEDDYTTAELEDMFEEFRQAYKGTKRGFKPEFENFKKKNQQNWKTIVPLLMPALQHMEGWREQQQAAMKFVPPYAMLQTWINQKRWTMEYELNNNNNNGTNEIGAGAAQDTEHTPNYDEEF